LVGGALAVELAGRSATPVVGAGPVRLALGDLTCYGLFAVLGAAWVRRPQGGRGRPAPRVALAVALGAASVGWAVVGGLPSGVANDSYPVLVLLGGAWLALVLAARGPLRRLGACRVVAPTVRALNRRAVTVYLWHPLAIVAAT